MTLFEILTLILTAWALWLTWQNHRLKKHQIDKGELNDWLEEQINRRLYRSIREEESQRQTANLGVEMVSRGGRGSYAFRITNNGGSAATNVNLDVAQTGEASPLVSGDYDRKLPWPQLDPGDHLDIWAAVNSSSPPPFDVTVAWDQPDGTRGSTSKRLSPN